MRVILRPVGVLVFVHHHEAELLGVARPRRAAPCQQLDGLQQEIVEVERAVVPQPLDVFLVDFHHLLAAMAPGRVSKELRAGHGVLRVADLRERLPWREPLSSICRSFITCLMSATWSDES